MERSNPGALTLPQEMMDIRDFKAAEAVTLKEGPLPLSYSVGKFVYTTNYQNGWGSCTSNATAHGLQILAVKNLGELGQKMFENGELKENIVTILRKDLRTKMGHDLNNKEDSGDYVENALKTACKAVQAEGGGEYKLKGYSYEGLNLTEAGIEIIKRYLFSDTPLVWAISGSSITWNEMTKGEVKTFIPVNQRTGGHCILCVGYDPNGLWFLNSRTPNDLNRKKSRFFISFDVMKKMESMNNWRYRPIFYETTVNPDYLKEKNEALLLLKVLRQLYEKTSYPKIKIAIEGFSPVLRGVFPELNQEFPLN